jgi:hypothetical protein
MPFVECAAEMQNVCFFLNYPLDVTDNNIAYF